MCCPNLSEVARSFYLAGLEEGGCEEWQSWAQFFDSRGIEAWITEYLCYTVIAVRSFPLNSSSSSLITVHLV